MSVSLEFYINQWGGLVKTIDAFSIPLLRDQIRVSHENPLFWLEIICIGVHCILVLFCRRLLNTHRYIRYSLWQRKPGAINAIYPFQWIQPISADADEKLDKNYWVTWYKDLSGPLDALSQTVFTWFSFLLVYSYILSIDFINFIKLTLCATTTLENRCYATLDQIVHRRVCWQFFPR